MALYVLEKTHVNLLIYAFLAVLNVGLDLVLIPKYGVYGAMVPVAIAILLQPFLYYAAVRRVDPGVSIPLAFIGRCFAASAFAVVMVPVLSLWGGAGGLIIAAIAGTVALVLGYRGSACSAPTRPECWRASVPGARGWRPGWRARRGRNRTER
jgi:O-antigen/teichoic acid export membrane protein